MPTYSIRANALKCREYKEKRGYTRIWNDMSECYLFAMAGYVHTLEKPSKIKENRHSNTLKYAILYAKFFENPWYDSTVLNVKNPQNRCEKS